jgi:aquaporin Z
MIDKIFLAEFIGTFFFLSIILMSGTALPIGIGLIAALYLVAPISGGHLNPAVSSMFYLNGTLDSNGLARNIIAQLLGAFCAYKYYQYNQSSISK